MVKEFIQLTGNDEGKSKFYLEAYSYNLEFAVQH